MMELMRFCFKESSSGQSSGSFSLCNVIQQSTCRVSCLTPLAVNDGVSTVTHQKNKEAKKYFSDFLNCSSNLMSKNPDGTPQRNLFPNKFSSEESTNIVLCCAMTESTRSSSVAGSSTGLRRDDRMKKCQHQDESESKKPEMLDVAVQAPDNSSGCDSMLSSSEHSSSMPKTVQQSNRNEFSKFFGRSSSAFNVGRSTNLSSTEGPLAQNLLTQTHGLPCSEKGLLSINAGPCDMSKAVESGSVSDEDRHLRTPHKEISLPVRQRLLTQCHSADNLLPSALLSDSSQSTPEPPPRRKKRSSSHETMSSCKPRPLSVGFDSNNSKKGGNLEEKGEAAAVVQFSASTENLARQSLLAAQLLHLIPTRKARERNFLHGRIAANSLLGTVELEKVLPARSVQVFVGTWNMNGQAPPPELNDLLLPEDLEHVPDILAFGTQESFPERFEWEVGIQETIGPSHVLLHSAVLGTLHLAVFVRRDLIWFCSVAEEGSFSVRPGTAFRTKGAVAIAFMLFGTSFLFVTSHLTAHAEKVKERLSDVKKIVRSLDLPKNLPCRHKNKDVTQNFDCVFWCGDLNFRLSQPREEVVDWVEKQQFPLISPHKMEMDQLKNSILQGAVFRGFEEGPITFKPTYKYDPGTQMFDSSQKQRTPSYTDRILFKCRHASRRTSSILGALPMSSPSGVPFLECLKYSSVQSVCTSDHKPVWGLFLSHIRPGIDTIPLAAGLFNREVYVEGINRRAAAMDKREGASAVCIVQ